MSSRTTNKKKQCQSFWTHPTSPCCTYSLFLSSPSDTIYRNKERKNMISEPGLWNKGTERNQKLPDYKCHHAQLQVSPRTVSPRTTKGISVITHNKEEEAVRIFLDPSYLTQWDTPPRDTRPETPYLRHSMSYEQFEQFYPDIIDVITQPGMWCKVKGQISEIRNMRKSIS